MTLLFWIAVVLDAVLAVVLLMLIPTTGHGWSSRLPAITIFRCERFGGERLLNVARLWGRGPGDATAEVSATTDLAGRTRRTELPRRQVLPAPHLPCRQGREIGC